MLRSLRRIPQEHGSGMREIINDCLERNARTELHVARRQVAVGCAEIGACVAVIGVDTVEIDAVEQVEHVEAKFQVHPLSNLSDLFHG